MSQPDPLAPMVALLAAYNRQDWARFRAGLTEHLVVADHRPAPALYDGIADPDEFIAALLPLFEMASEVSVQTVGSHVVGPRAGVFRLSTTGLTAEGSEFELAFHLGYVLDADKVSRFEFFGDDQLDAACTRLRSIVERGEA